MGRERGAPVEAQMKVLITDLTRMYDGHICVAGIDVDTGKRVRPVTFGRLGAELLCIHGGPLDIGNVVEFEVIEHCGSAPEIEDVRCDPVGIRLVRSLSQPEFMAVLHRDSSYGLGAFGPSLIRIGDSMATPRGQGDASLALVRWSGTIMINSYKKIRASMGDGVWVSVTDVRLYQHDLLTPDESKVRRLSGAIGRSGVTVASLGLARAWKQPEDDQERHYMQMNNIHPAQWADWRLC
jgi:hypothetical protein